jgi:large subunit ribosomal protein L21
MPQYAIISLGGKQYVVREGETIVVDRLDGEQGKTFQPDVLFLGGDGDGELAPKSSVTAKVVGHERGPKIRIGKYKPKVGYKRHTGFRSSLTRIEITGIGGKAARSTAKAEAPKTEAPAEKPIAEAAAPTRVAHPPKGYEEMTVAQITESASGWRRPNIEAALEYEKANANRKGAIAALEAALAAKEDH